VPPGDGPKNRIPTWSQIADDLAARVAVAVFLLVFAMAPRAPP